MLAVSLGRLPYGMNILALILLLRAAGFDYAEVGIVTAASGLSVGLAAPVHGPRDRPRRADEGAARRRGVHRGERHRVRDRGAGGRRRDAGDDRSPSLTGLVVPPVSPSLRALLPGLVGPGAARHRVRARRPPARAGVHLGPLLAAGIATAISPEVGVPDRRRPAGGGRARRRGLPALAGAGGRRHASRARGRKGALTHLGHPRAACSPLALTAVSLGVLEIAIPAFAEEHATRDDAGWLFALWSLGSLAGGLWYGARRMAAARRTCASSS